MTELIVPFETKWGLAIIEVSQDKKPARIILPPARINKKAVIVKPDDTIKRWVAFLRNYFNGNFTKPPRIDDLLPQNFSFSTYRALQKIPAGKVVTYKQLASYAGRDNAPRAVGQALAKNPFPIVVPCHRVISSNGSLGGFSARGGIGYKKRLLSHEGVNF